MNEKSSTGKSGADLVYNMETNWPQVISAINSTAVPTAQAQGQADVAYGQTAQRGVLDLLKSFGPELAKIGGALTRQDTLQSAALDNELAAGVGRQNVLAADALQRIVDPEYYAGRAAVGDAGTRLLSSVDPSRLTAGEEEGVARGLARTGQSLLPGGNAAVNSALTFGEEGARKKDRFASYLSQVGASLAGLRSGMDAFGTATRKPTQVNPGMSNFVGLQRGTADQNYAGANNFMNGTFGNQRAQYSSALDQTGKAISTGSQGLGMVAGLAGMI